MSTDESDRQPAATAEEASWSQKTERGRRMAHLLEKGHDERIPLLSDAQVEQELSAHRGRSYAAVVNITLLIAGHTVPITQLGPDFLLLDNPFNLAPCEAALVLQVGQSEQRWNIYLPSGISARSERVEIKMKP